MNPQRILFATMPMDGHFSPLTGLAMHLHQCGHDVRWYVGGHYGQKVERLGLHHYPFVKAQTINQDNFDTVFPERSAIKGMLARLRFDISQLFLLRAPEFMEDLTAIHNTWSFDILVYDVAFAAGPFAKELLGVKTVSIGVVPLPESDDYVSPAGLGMPPRAGVVGRQVQRLIQRFVQKVIFKPCQTLYNQLRLQHGLAPAQDFFFDDIIRSADLYLQSGVPGFEYPRKRISPNVRFVGPLLPYNRRTKSHFDAFSKTLTYRRVVLATQGTVERDVAKVLMPTLEAFKDDPDTLVIATTGGAQTDMLRARYPQSNFIIEDFIDFDAVMPYADVYITNGGYGGVMLALQHQLPVVVAGVHEGKNEIAARIGYYKLGINLKTETPKPKQIRRAAKQLFFDETYRQRVQHLSHEFDTYHPNQLSERYIHTLVADPSALEAIA